MEVAFDKHTRHKYPELHLTKNYDLDLLYLELLYLELL